MPEISRFFGIIIRMYQGDHVPPHFHAFYGDEEVQINIETTDIIKGSLPLKQLRMVQLWATLHQFELMENFNELYKGNYTWIKIEPLKL